MMFQWIRTCGPHAACATRRRAHCPSSNFRRRLEDGRRPRRSFDYGRYGAAVGLEVHAQITADSKLLSHSSTDITSPPNSCVSLFDAAIPGTLPVLNKHCLLAAVRTGLALKATIASETSFDRKHYFYADLPHGYQITQQRQPIATNGSIEYAVFNHLYHEEAYVKRSIVKQLHLEMDSGKSLTQSDGRDSLVDLNRAAKGLMEIVFEPDVNDGEEAASLVRDLILLMRELQTCDCRMGDGCLRVDANVSIREVDDESNTKLGTRTEIKNLNSLRSMVRAIDFEIRRQIQVLETGGSVEAQTMRFDDKSGETVVMRDKETGSVSDYRFMPEANLPLIRLRDSQSHLDSQSSNNSILDVNDLRQQLPPSPQQQRTRLMQDYDLDLKTAMTLMNMTAEKELFEQVICILRKEGSLLPASAGAMDTGSSPSSVVFRVLCEELPQTLESLKLSLSQCPLLTPQLLSEICAPILRSELSYALAGDIISLKARDESRSVSQLMRENQWFKVTDPLEVLSFCQQAIDGKPKRAKEVRNKGKEFAFTVLVEETMRLSHRRIDVETVTRTLIQLLQPPDGRIVSGKERRLEREKGLSPIGE